MAECSGKKHIISALMRRYTDRIPVTVLIGPYCSRLTNYSVKEILQDAKKSAEAHLAFYNRLIMEDVVETGINFLSLDAPSSLQRLIQIGNGKVAVMGNIPTTLFNAGTHQEMETAIRDCIQTAAEGSGYILASGCEIPMNSTEDRISHFFNYGRQYGRQFMSNLEKRRPA